MPPSSLSSSLSKNEKASKRAEKGNKGNNQANWVKLKIGWTAIQIDHTDHSEQKVKKATSKFDCGISRPFLNTQRE